MARDTLVRLYTMRQRAADRAVQALAACLSTETEAAASVAAIENAIPIERASVDAVAGAPHVMETYARWSAEVRSQHQAALAALALAQRETTGARALLAEARSEARAVEELIAVRAARAREMADRREAHTLDDIARKRRPASDG
jgi:flagellar export protein FliJ